MQANKEIIALLWLLFLTAIIVGFILGLYYRHSLRHRNNHHGKNPSISPQISPSSVTFLGTLVQSHDNDTINSNSNSNKTKKRKKSLNSSPLMKTRALFIMGDASVDCGENSMFYPLLFSNLSFYPCSHGFDSTLIPHFLAKKLNLPPIPTFYGQNGTIEGILNGLNYGSAQATILTRENDPNFQSLNQQLRQAFETIQLLQLLLGEVEAHNFVSNSVFYLSLGKDDYINLFFENLSGYNGNTQQFPSLLVFEMTNVLRDLYDGGVRKVIVMGIYPLGCAPRAVVNWHFLSGKISRRIRACVSEINQLITQYNQLLNDRIIDLNLELAHAQFIFCDVFEGFKQILANPQKFGFEDTRTACCGTGWHGAAEGCHSIEHACNRTSAHVWWDFYNPTEAVNSLLADAAWSGQVLGDICHPMSIQGLVKI